MTGSSPRKSAAEVDHTNARKLTADELKHSADRLSQPPRRNIELPPLTERRVITQDDVNKSLERLYGQYIVHRKHAMVELEKKTHPDMVKHVQLDRDSLETMFNRLYNSSVDQKKQNLDKLRTQYLHPHETKTLTREEIEQSNKRLYNECLDHTRENHNKLFEKYVVSSMPQFPKLSKEQQKAMAERLCVKKGA